MIVRVIDDLGKEGETFNLDERGIVYTHQVKLAGIWMNLHGELVLYCRGEVDLQIKEDKISLKQKLKGGEEDD